MKLRMLQAAVVVAQLAIAGTAFAQAPADAPSGSTGLCKDGSYSTAATKRGACAGHKGVKSWFAADAGAKPAASASAPPAAAAGAPIPATAGPAPSAAPARSTAAAAGGGNGQVWVNTATKVYHCSGDRWYGKTKAGEYMSESAAVAAGDRPDHGKACKAG